MIQELGLESRKVREYLGMSTLPVGVKLIRQGDQIDTARYDKADSQKPFCWYVHEASRGKSFFVRWEDLDCNKAEIVLGFREPRFANIEPRIKEKIAAIRIGPVEDADTVMLVVNPEQSMTLTNLLPEIELSFRKNRTVCGEGMASVFNTKQPTMTLLCIGARTDGDFQADELLVTLPYRMFMEVPSRMNKFTSLSRQAVDSLTRRFRKLH